MGGIIDILFWETQAASSTSDQHPHQVRMWPVWSKRGGALISPGILLYWWIVSRKRKYFFISNISCGFGHWFLTLRTKQKSIISFLNNRLWNILKFYVSSLSRLKISCLLFDRSSVFLAHSSSWHIVGSLQIFIGWKTVSSDPREWK